MRRRPHFSRKSQGSWSGGQGEHPQVQLVPQEQFQRPVRRRSPGLIPVEDQDHALGEPSQSAEVVGTQGRAQRAHDVAQPDLMGRDHVGIALDDRHPARLPARRPRQVRRIEQCTFVEKHRLGSVQIFRDVPALRLDRALGVRQDPPAETDGPAAVVVDREDQAAAEPLADRAPLIAAAADEAGLLQQVHAEAPLPRQAQQPAAGHRRETQAKLFGARTRQAPTFQVTQRLRRLPQRTGKNLFRPGVDLEQLRLRRTPRRSGGGRRRRLLQHNPRPIRQHAQRLSKIHVFVILHEIKDVPAGPATPAFVRLAFRVQLEGRIVVVVERAKRLVFITHTAQGQRLTDQGDNVNRVFYGG